MYWNKLALRPGRYQQQSTLTDTLAHGKRPGIKALEEAGPVAAAAMTQGPARFKAQVA